MGGLFGTCPFKAYHSTKKVYQLGCGLVGESHIGISKMIVLLIWSVVLVI